MNSNYLIIIAVTMALSIAGFILLKKSVEQISRGIIVYSVAMTLIIMVIAVTLQRVYGSNGLIFNIKRICLLTILAPVALIDYREYKIPNRFIIAGLVYRMLIIPFELLYDSENILQTFLSEIIACVALLLAAVLCRLCVKNSIGAGDIKLFAVMGLMLSLKGIWSAIFMSLIVSFFMSVYLLISKKKTRKDKIPFGPALAIGTFLTVFLTGM